MNKLMRFGVSLEENLLKDLDKLVKQNKFPNRSQAIRFLIRNHLVDEACADNQIVSGSIVMIFDHHKRNLINKALDIQHDFGDVILASQHIHLDHHNCLELLALKGKAATLRKLSNELLALKGVKHGKLVMSSAEIKKS